MKAEFIAHCKPGPVPCCQKHADAIKQIYKVLGWPVTLEIAPPDTECESCKAESELKK